MNFDYHFDIHLQTRKNILKRIERLSVDQMNTIPKGFNNNLVWNLGHIITTQQLLVYRNAGLPVYFPEELILQFKKGSKPKNKYGDIEIEVFKIQLGEFAEQMRTDFNSDFFAEYKPYETSYGMQISSVAEAIVFNNVHEALHLGIIGQFTKLV